MLLSNNMALSSNNPAFLLKKAVGSYREKWIITPLSFPYHLTFNL